MSTSCTCSSSFKSVGVLCLFLSLDFVLYMIQSFSYCFKTTQLNVSGPVPAECVSAPQGRFLALKESKKNVEIKVSIQAWSSVSLLRLSLCSWADIHSKQQNLLEVIFKMRFSAISVCRCMVSREINFGYIF